MTDMLHHEPIAGVGAMPAQWLYVLHGIFGAGRNWASVMRHLVRRRPDWGAVLVDLREHGRSTGFPPPHTLAAAAADLERLIGATARPAAAVLGHSFGGKVALLFAREHAATAPRSGLRQLWIVDSLPAPVPVPLGSAWDMLARLRAQPGPFPDRAAAVNALRASGLSDDVARWISTNLEPRPAGGLDWRLDLDALEALLRSFFRADLWDVVTQPPAGLHIHFLRADSSGVMPERMAARIEELGRRNGQVELHRVAGGHWLNADNPAAVEQLLVHHLPPPPGAGPLPAS